LATIINKAPDAEKGMKMIDLYYWPTPNGHKITIALEEMGLEYSLKKIDIGKGDQFDPAFLAFSPNNRMPAIIDHDVKGKPQTVFESGAILIYLAEKTGQLIPKDPRDRISTIEWLMWQMGGLGPMLGQAHHFTQYAPEPIDYAIERYSNEANRLYGVMERQLANNEWLAGSEYTIADIAAFPWTRTYDRQGVNIDEYPHVRDWQAKIFSRPAVEKGMKAGSEWSENLKNLDESEWKKLFGQGS
jgi:GST-like protein